MTRASWRLCLQPLAVFSQPIGLLTDCTLGSGEALRQRTVETFMSLLGLRNIEMGADPFSQIETERLARKQLRKAFLFGITLTTLQQRRTLLAE